MPRRDTGPLLRCRIGEAKKAPKETYTNLGGFDRKTTSAAVMIVAAALFGVELAEIIGGTRAVWSCPSWEPSGDRAGLAGRKKLYSRCYCRDTGSPGRW